MTTRQLRLARRIAEDYEQVVALVKAALVGQPIGYSCVVSLMGRFHVVQGELVFTEPRLFVMRVPEGYLYREYRPGYFGRKGRAEPKPRLLAAG